MPEHPVQSGSPQIQVAGLQIWVHRRQFPEAHDYWDGNWIKVTAHCGAPGAEVWTTGVIIHLSEIKRWADGCEQMYKTLSGEARLDCMEPELSVAMNMQEQGHISMAVSITPDDLTQKHTFQFAIDQSHLPTLIKECQRLLCEYPIRNENNSPATAQSRAINPWLK